MMDRVQSLSKPEEKENEHVFSKGNGNINVEKPEHRDVDDISLVASKRRCSELVEKAATSADLAALLVYNASLLQCERFTIDVRGDDVVFVGRRGNMLTMVLKTGVVIEFNPCDCKAHVYHLAGETKLSWG